MTFGSRNVSALIFPSDESGTPAFLSFSIRTGIWSR